MEHLRTLVELHALLINQLGVVGEDHYTMLLPGNFTHLACGLRDVVSVLESEKSGDDGSCWRGMFRIWALA